MPYSDPEQKRAYMAKYNPKYYGENREPLIRKNTTRKKDLRERKKEHILKRYETLALIVVVSLCTLSSYTLSIKWKTHLRNLSATCLGHILSYCSTIITLILFVQPANIVENLPTMLGLEVFSIEK